MSLWFGMPNQMAKVRVSAVANRQSGRIASWQLERLGVAKGTVAGWLEQGYLHRRLPGVYAVGHVAPSDRAELVEALLYASPGAALSHASAAWWLGLVDQKPREIHVSTPRKCQSLPGIAVHARRRFERTIHRGLPVIQLPQLFLDLAATEPLRTVRRALARADFHGWLDAPAVAAHCGRGRPGSPVLRRALAKHLPQLARTKSELEIAFLELCERRGLRLPDTNQYVAGWEVDALWLEQRIAVELDGRGNHSSFAQMQRDRQKDLELRAAGFTPLRYTGHQLDHEEAAVHTDLCRAGAPSSAVRSA